MCVYSESAHLDAIALCLYPPDFELRCRIKSVDVDLHAALTRGLFIYTYTCVDLYQLFHRCSASVDEAGQRTLGEEYAVNYNPPLS